jgi:prepilin-type N-terminal cleavage/methylation domain-containing protein
MSATRRPRPTRGEPCAIARAQRGFTLVELMVAMVAAMFVAIAVFTLAKHASGFAMRQSRVADATLQTVIGFERLKADIARAGFLSSPNIARDPNICRAPVYPPQLRRLAGVFIEPMLEEDGISAEATANGITPNRIVLAGSYDSPDLFVARTITPSDPPVVYLSPTSLGMANIGYTTADAALGAAALGRVFRIGRALRIVDDAGGVQFGTIAAIAGGLDPSITLTDSPELQFRATSGQKCGIRGHGNDFVNVVNFIRYEIQDLSSTGQFSGMFAGARPPFDGERRELVREELGVDGQPIAGTLELVAEYAVDLGFSLFVSRSPGAALTRVLPADIGDFAGDPNFTGAGRGPQLIRAVHAWLSLRSQEADRAVGITPLTSEAPGPNLLRISVNPLSTVAAPLPPFARVRTLQSTIPLNNQMRATWQ